MKNNILAYSGLFAILTGLFFTACKKTEGITAYPTASITTAQYNTVGSTVMTPFMSNSSLSISEATEVTLTINVKTDAKLKQVTAAIWGAETNFTTAGFMTSEWAENIKITGFASGTEDNFTFVIKNVKSKITLTLQVTDEKGLVTGQNFEIDVFQATGKNSATLFSEISTNDDATAEGEILGNYFISTTNQAVDASTASSDKNAFIDFKYDSTAVTPTLHQPSFKDTDGNYTLPGLFTTTTLDIGDLTTMVLSEAIVDAFPEVPKNDEDHSIEVATGASYLFTTANGNSGILKISSIKDGTVSGAINGIISYEFVILKELK